MPAKLTPPLKWHGGKHYVAPRVIELMPPHLHYVEPYFGGGQVLFARDVADRRLWWTGLTSDGRKPDGVSEVINDAGSASMQLAPTEFLSRHHLSGRRFDERRPTKEDRALTAHDHRLVAHGGDVRAARCA